MKIDRFEIDSYGCVKIRSAYHNGRTTEHEYNGVPKKIILKLLNAKSAPEISDFDQWMKDYRAKQDKKYEDCAIGCCDFWTDDDG
jgi:hypothetical protein